MREAGIFHGVSLADMIGDLSAPWRRHAACADMDPAMFFPERGTTTHHAVLNAKTVCVSCPVRLACLEDALNADGLVGQYGIWGGLTEKERQRLKRKVVDGTATLADTAVKFPMAKAEANLRRNKNPICPTCRHIMSPTRGCKGCAG